MICLENLARILLLVVELAVAGWRGLGYTWAAERRLRGKVWFQGGFATWWREETSVLVGEEARR